MAFWNDVKDCSNSYIETQIGIKKTIKGKVPSIINPDKEKTFVGIDVSMFIGVGFKFKIGFNI